MLKPPFGEKWENGLAEAFCKKLKILGWHLRKDISHMAAYSCKGWMRLAVTTFACQCAEARKAAGLLANSQDFARSRPTEQAGIFTSDA